MALSEGYHAIGPAACGLFAPYRADAGVRRSKGVPMTATSDVDHVSALLSSAAIGPAALLIEGEAGIGKTTAWLTAVERARSAGFRVLSARASRDEQHFVFGIASELIADVEPEVLASLPQLQLLAVERNLRNGLHEHAVDDRRAVVAAFTAIVKKLANVSPVLIAVDDVGWLDAASRDLLAFAARRLRGPVGLLLTERTTLDGVATWLRLDDPDALSRMRIRPMDLSGLQRLVSDRVGRTYSRPTMMRIAEVSGGNPFYALELARAVGIPTDPSTASLPPALAEIMHRRVGHFDDAVKGVLLAAACVSDPTVDVLATMRSTSVDRLVELLEGPETLGVVTIEGNRIRFTHPVLAYGVYSQASPAHRRRMHRILADLESTPDRRARHMALAIVSPDPDTLMALDVAATTVDVEGDPVAAAELIELAIGLGGGTPSRRLVAARHHLRSGDLARSYVLAESALTALPSGGQRVAAWLLMAGSRLCHGDFESAVEILQSAQSDATKRPGLLLHVHLCSALAQLSLGDADAAQRHCMQAITRAESAGDPHLISQALAIHVVLQCRRGLGLDAATLARAMELEDLDVDTPAPFSAHAVNALVLAWMGRLTEAESQLSDVMERSITRGADSELPWLQFHAAMVEIGMGRYSDAARTAAKMLLWAEQTGSSYVRMLATVPSALAAVYSGREQDARTQIGLATRGQAERTPWPTIALGILEVSLGNYAEALNALRPFVSRHGGDVDMVTFYVIPDAVEAMIAVGDLDEADELTTSLELTGSRLSQPWMAAIGTRCRSMVLAARGDLGGAEHAAARAMTEHRALAAPFERARTQLVLGQVQRRLRHRQAARATLQEAYATFEALGAPIWAARAAATLGRVQVVRGRDSVLTPAERRVAELAAAGMTNKDVAAALFISPKTVEYNLGRVYRKLGIRTRVELGRTLSADERGPALD